MASSLRGRDLLDLKSLLVPEIARILELAQKLKRKPFGAALKDKTVVMLFAKPSTRTRVSFEVAINQQAGDDIYLETQQTQLSRGESVKDTANVLSRYCDAIVARLFSHQDLLELAQHASVPVVNGLTNLHHPCQVLSDLFTLIEKGRKLPGLKVAFFGDGGSNVCHSLMEAATKMQMELTIACPKAYGPDPAILKENPGVAITANPARAAKDADVLYTDVWVSMGEERQARARLAALRRYQLTQKLVGLAKPDCLVMHDLPAHRGQEVAAEVLDGPRSIIYDQAENRLHVEKAILALLLGK